MKLSDLFSRYKGKNGNVVSLSQFARLLRDSKVLNAAISYSTAVSVFDGIATKMQLEESNDEGDSETLSYAGFERAMKLIATIHCKFKTNHAEIAGNEFELADDNELSTLLQHFDKELHERPRSEQDAVLTKLLEPQNLRVFQTNHHGMRRCFQRLMQRHCWSDVADTNATLIRNEMNNIFREMGVAPPITTEEIGVIFRSCNFQIAALPIGDSDSTQTANFNFPEFTECCARCALLPTFPFADKQNNHSAENIHRMFQAMINYVNNAVKIDAAASRNQTLGTYTSFVMELEEAPCYDSTVYHLQKIFMFYCDPTLSTEDRIWDIDPLPMMRMGDMRRFIRDSGVLDNVVSWLDVDRLTGAEFYGAVAIRSNTQIASSRLGPSESSKFRKLDLRNEELAAKKAISQGQLTFEMWSRTIVGLSRAKYPLLPPPDAITDLIWNCILPSAAQIPPDSLIDFIFEDSGTLFRRTYFKAFLYIYSHFGSPLDLTGPQQQQQSSITPRGGGGLQVKSESTPSAFVTPKPHSSNTTEEDSIAHIGLSLRGFLLALRAFNLIPNLLSPDEAIRLFPPPPSAVNGQTPEYEFILQDHKILFPAFVDCLFRVAVACYSKPPFDTKFVSVEEKVLAFATNLEVNFPKACGCVVPIEGEEDDSEIPITPPTNEDFINESSFRVFLLQRRMSRGQSLTLPKIVPVISRSGLPSISSQPQPDFPKTAAGKAERAKFLAAEAARRPALQKIPRPNLPLSSSSPIARPSTASSASLSPFSSSVLSPSMTTLTSMSVSSPTVSSSMFSPLTLSPSAKLTGMPSFIREQLYAPTCPPHIAVLLETALVHHNAARFERAIESYLEAIRIWQQNADENRLSAETYTFFFNSIGSVYESRGLDEIALACFTEGRIWSSKLSRQHEATALSWSNAASIFFHLKLFDVALSFLNEALRKREQSVGAYHMDTGLILNNIGCCLDCLGRVSEARDKYVAAQDIFEFEYGFQHPRSVVTRRNLERVRHQQLDFDVKFSPLKPMKVPAYLVPKQKEKKEKKAKKEKKGKKK